MRSTLLVRPAEPKDRPFIVETIRTATTSHLPHCVWDRLLGRPAAQVDAVLGRLCGSSRPQYCHLSRFLVAERRGEPVGALSGFDTATEGNDAVKDAFLDLVGDCGFSDDELAAVLLRAAELARGTPPNVEGSWGIENVAVRREHRGTGVVDALLERVLDAGRQRGYHKAQVISLNGNIRAEHVWRRHGFSLASDYRDVSFERTFGTPGLCLYLRDL